VGRRRRRTVNRRVICGHRFSAEGKRTMDLWSWLSLFFWMYIFFACIWIFITVLIDVFRDDTLGGGAKALWTILVLILPLVGPLIYLIARGKSMAARRYRETGIVPEPTDYVPRFGD
jgi:hypothetical protein